ncbi:MAG TPA: response regulator transcription factor [Verrucomicrobiota bacterium]|nr:response regulator transcription factor [Verrucomicrobiota bacterium]HOK77574.1 response regulator transcription factor [Verrucomicrobiota bacterium]
MLRILVVDDHALIRRGLRQVIGEGWKDAVVGEARNASEALEQIYTKNWDVVVADITMPGRSGLDLLREIKAANPKLPVIILSVHAEEELGVRAIRSGAAGYVSKECAPDQLVEAIRKVLSGGRYIGPKLAEKIAQYIGSDIEKPLHETLSDREYEVLSMIGEGKTPTEIAKALSLSVKTVSTYRSRIMAKMKLKATPELIRYAIQHGIVR